jgi:uncharacterized protein YgiB involved in biofilm formation
MKRSATVSLLLIGTAAALVGCGEPEKQVDAAAYKNADQCIADGKFSREDCLADFTTAMEDFKTTAPIYQSKADCEAEFGADKCQARPDQQVAGQVPTGTTSAASTTNGGGGFSPFMMGYFMGSHSASSPVVMQPQALYAPRAASGFTNSQGTVLSNGLGRFKLSTRDSVVAAPSKPAAGVVRTYTAPRSFSSAYSSPSSKSSSGFFSSSSKTTSVARGGFGGRSSFSFGG